MCRGQSRSTRLAHALSASFPTPVVLYERKSQHSPYRKGVFFFQILYSSLSSLCRWGEGGRACASERASE